MNFFPRTGINNNDSLGFFVGHGERGSKDIIARAATYGRGKANLSIETDVDYARQPPVRPVGRAALGPVLTRAVPPPGASQSIQRAARNARPAVVLSAGGRLALSITEAAALVITSLAAHFGYDWIVLGVETPMTATLAVGLLAGLIYAGAMHIVDNARRLRPMDGREALSDAALAWIAACLLVTFFAFSLKAGATLSRGTLLTFFVLGFATIMLVRTTGPRILARTISGANRGDRKVLAIGVPGRGTLERMMRELSANGNPNILLAELPAGLTNAEWNDQLPAILGNIFTKARETGHGDICIAAGGIAPHRLKGIIEATRILPQAVHLVPDRAEEELLHFPIGNVGHLRSFEIQRAPMNVAQRSIKRSLDLLIAIPLAAVLSPFLALIALAIKIDSAGPVLFLQRRLGFRGKVFRIVKFRTMTVLEDGDTVRQVRKGDTQVTRVGRFLRKTSLDELPQLINVIEGSMSLVGPRPHAVAHDIHFAGFVEHYEVRQHVKPGITGLAQVNGYRGETATPDAMRKRVEHDIAYAKHASLWLDVKILMLTALEVVRQRNAY